MSDNEYAEEEEPVDIADYFAPLTREAIEIILVRMLHLHPESTDFFLEECKKKVNTSQLEAALTAMANSPTLTVGLPTIAEFINQAEDYARIHDTNNALTILDLITPAVVKFTMAHQDEVKAEKDGDEPGAPYYLSCLENVWTSVFSIEDAEIDDVKYFQEMSGWRVTLQALMGPLFSEPLRTLKKKIKSSSKRSAVTESSTSSKKQKL